MMNKRYRRTKAEMNALRTALYEIAQEIEPCSVRGLFYQIVRYGHIPKTEEAYTGIVMRLVGELREDGEMPWNWITDGTRLMRKPTTYSSMEEAARDAARTYRRDLWRNQEVYLEVWCEKMALLGVIYEVTAKWDVPLMISRGFAIKDFCYRTAESIALESKPAYLYQVGDHDPSGVKAWEAVETSIRRYLDRFFNYQECVTFDRIAVTPEQIEEYSLPTRPTKRDGNSHARGFKGDSVEADAMPPDVLRNLIESHIRQHVDEDALRVVQVAEKSEREALEIFAQTVGTYTPNEGQAES